MIRPLQKVKIFAEYQRPKIDKIPSPKCQTILYQSAMHHLWGEEHFATFVLISETFRNSSFGANFLMNFTIDDRMLPLFSNVLTPQKCLSLQFIHSLSINVYECDDSDGVTNFASRLVSTKYLHRQLHELSLESANESLIACFFNEQAVASNNNTKQWAQLKKLAITNADLGDEELEIIAVSAPSLTSLDINGCAAVSDIGIQKITSSSSLKLLTHLDLRECTGVSDAGLLAVSKNLPALTYIDLSWCKLVTDVGLSHIAQGLTSLATIHLHQCGWVNSLPRSSSITDVGLRNLSSLVSLKTLDISECNKITDVGLRHISEKITALTSLDLFNVSRVTDAGIEYIASNLPALTFLNLMQSYGVTDRGIISIAQKLTALTSLNLSCNHHLTDSTLEMISTNLTALTFLDIACCDKITDAGFRSIANLSALTSLDISNVEQVTDAGMSKIAKLATLTFLRLDGCCLITNIGLQHIRESASMRLSYLYLEGCDKITVEAKLQFKANNPCCRLGYY